MPDLNSPEFHWSMFQMYLRDTGVKRCRLSTRIEWMKRAIYFKRKYDEAIKSRAS